jgi:hypothetical protein
MLIPDEVAVLVEGLFRERKFPVWENIESTFSAFELLSFATPFGIGVLCLEFHRYSAGIIFFSLGCALLSVRMIAIAYKQLRGLLKWLLVLLICAVAIYTDIFLHGIALDAQSEWLQSEDRRNRAEFEEKRKTAQQADSPKLSPTIEAVEYQDPHLPIPPGKKFVVLLVVAILNGGSPSIAQGFELLIDKPNQPRMYERYTALPRGSLTIKGTGGTVTYTEKDALYLRGMKPIEHGGIARGVLLFMTDKINGAEFDDPSIKFSLAFSDVKGKQIVTPFHVYGKPDKQSYFPGLPRPR